MTKPAGYGTAGASRAEAHTVSFIGPNGTWTTTCDTPLTAVNEAVSELHLGNVTAAHIRPVVTADMVAAYHLHAQRLHYARRTAKAARRANLAGRP